MENSAFWATVITIQIVILILCFGLAKGFNFWSKRVLTSQAQRQDTEQQTNQMSPQTVSIHTYNQRINPADGEADIGPPPEYTEVILIPISQEEDLPSYTAALRKQELILRAATATERESDRESLDESPSPATPPASATS